MRATPHIRHLVLIVLLGPAAIQGCRSQPPERQPMAIIVREAALYQYPDRSSPQVATLTYGQQVLALKKKSSQAVGAWIDVRLDKDRSGFVKESALGTLEIMATLQQLQQSIEGIETQASGMTTTPTYLRLEPGRQGKTVEKLPTGTHFEMFQRQAWVPAMPQGVILYKPPPKEIWYKIQLDDGRVGYIFSKHFKLEPPSEILKYAGPRRVMAWLKLKTVTGEGFDPTDEYLVAYASADADFGADFDRIEGYSWNRGHYQTAVVLKPLRGILPLRVIRQGEEVYFELTELDPDHKNQVIVHRYLYAYPYKKVESTSLKWDVGLH